MFNRNKTSYHDSLVLNAEDVELFIDKFSAKYLKLCINPALQVRMVGARPTPVLSICGAGIGSDKKEYLNQVV
jgi:hypothetical protein